MKKIVTVFSLVQLVAAGMIWAFMSSFEEPSLPEAPEVVFTDGPGIEITQAIQQSINTLLEGINRNHLNGDPLNELVNAGMFSG
jgi:hypothetical protein